MVAPIKKAVSTAAALFGNLPDANTTPPANCTARPAWTKKGTLSSVKPARTSAAAVSFCGNTPNPFMKKGKAMRVRLMFTICRFRPADMIVSSSKFFDRHLPLPARIVENSYAAHRAYARVATEFQRTYPKALEITDCLPRFRPSLTDQWSPEELASVLD